MFFVWDGVVVEEGFVGVFYGEFEVVEMVVFDVFELGEFFVNVGEGCGVGGEVFFVVGDVDVGNFGVVFVFENVGD